MLQPLTHLRFSQNCPIQTAVFWDVKLHSFVICYQRVGGVFCLKELPDLPLTTLKTETANCSEMCVTE